jgi:hypothetical protein
MKNLQKLKDYATSQDNWYIEKVLASLEVEIAIAVTEAELKGATNKTLSDFLKQN